MRITETFVVNRPPEVVFDYMTDPSNLASWQTSKTSVEQLSDGPPGLGTRVRERTKPPGGREFEQLVEFTEFTRPRRFHVHIVEGPAVDEASVRRAIELSATKYCSVAAMLSAGTVEIHHRYRIVGPDGAAPIEGEVIISGPHADPDSTGKPQLG